MSTADGSAAARVRRSERVRTHVPVTLIWHADSLRQVEHTYTVAVSRFGCKVLCRCCLAPGSAVRLEYDRRIILGRICFCLKDHATKLTELGIGFDEDGTDFWGISFED